MDERMVIVGDHYFGDLAVKGYGDPMLQYTVLMQMLRQTPLVGVKQFHGHLYIDDTAFDNERFGPDWNYDMAKEIGAMIFRNTTLAKTGDSPETVPVNVGRTLQLILKALKLNQKGQIYPGRPIPARMKVVASSESESLLTIMGYGNRASDNSILEQIFKTISQVKVGQGSASKSAELLKEFYAKQLGLDPAQYQIVDGCGLSRNNQISPLYLGTMLEYGYAHPFVDKEVTLEEAHALMLAGQNPYINTLAVAGGDGTLQERMKHLRVFGKTGTLNGVDALSGYVITASGQVVVFSFLVNNFTISRSEVRDWEDSIVQMIFEHY
jgi:D-alanyl-D-alanine carboxypeptidase/D-alanyl-D-alanine-endopeptidase (penicillin-binding protein 4)